MTGAGGRIHTKVRRERRRLRRRGEEEEEEEVGFDIYIEGLPVLLK